MGRISESLQRNLALHQKIDESRDGSIIKPAVAPAYDDGEVPASASAPADRLTVPPTVSPPLPDAVPDAAARQPVVTVREVAPALRESAGADGGGLEALDNMVRRRELRFSTVGQDSDAEGIGEI